VNDLKTKVMKVSRKETVDDLDITLNVIRMQKLTFHIFRSGY
jgi:hypothetical protein